MITLRKGELAIEICEIGEYYLGTRFDRAGVFRRITRDGYAYADEWFPEYDPCRHDAVCGPSEEFMTVDFEGVGIGDTFLKPGVGLLVRPDGEEYDRFRLYPISDPGKWTVCHTSDKVVFTHVMSGLYRYVKTIELVSDREFSIRHRLTWEAGRPLAGHSYNHNFFTFGSKPVGPDRRIEFPFRPVGNWRKHYDNAGIEDRSIVFHGAVDRMNSVFIGDLHNGEGETLYDIILSDCSHRVHITGSCPATHCVLWASDSVACIEPYVPVQLGKGECAEWDIRYEL